MTRPNRMTKIWVFLCTAFLLRAGFSQEEKEDKVFRRKKVFQIKGSTIKNPLELRDPFKKKRVKERRKRNVGRTILVDNSYSNLPNIGTVPLKSIRIVGILLGKKRVAMASVERSKQVFFLREGMKIGENKSEIRAILPGGIVVVEKIRNVYDQNEYIETVIPFSGGS